jgi:hypothetical protein
VRGGGEDRRTYGNELWSWPAVALSSPVVVGCCAIDLESQHDRSITSSEIALLYVLRRKYPSSTNKTYRPSSITIWSSLLIAQLAERRSTGRKNSPSAISPLEVKIIVVLLCT